MIGKTLLHYRIKEKLGAGGMGEVFRAHDTKLSRDVALKILPAETASNPERLRRFHREARTVAALKHPNIVMIHAVEEADGLPFLIMELAEGRTLADIISRGGLTLERTFELAIPLADAIAGAHAQSITHRDLKPSNIMLDRDGRLKVLDFGLAKLLGQGPHGVTLMTQDMDTHEGGIVGTPAYMSPEQAEGKRVDHRSDIFSLGIILHEMVTGEHPFRRESTLSTLSAIVKENPPSVADLNTSLPRHLGRVIQHCLAKDPERRYQSAKDVRNELEALKKELESGQLTAGAERTGESGSAEALPDAKRAGRKPVLLYVVIAAVVLLAGLGIARVLHLGPWASLLSKGVIQERERVILADFENLTEDPVTGATVTELMRIGLSRSRTVSLVDPGQVGRILQMMKRDPVDGLSPETALEVAERDGIRAVITGNVAPVGDRLALTASLIGVDGKVLVAESESAEDANGLTAAVDRLSGRLRERCGETISRAEAAVPLDKVTTGSIDALRTFSQGLRASNQGDQARALQLIAEAIEQDTTFAMAYRKLAILLNNEGDDRSRAVWAATKAFAHRDRLTEREKYLVVAAYHSVVTGNTDLQISAYRTVLDMHPDDSYSLNNLGVIYGQLRDFEKAAVFYEKALGVDSTLALHYSNLASSLATLRNFDAADSVARRFETRFPHNPSVKLAYTINAAQKGEYDSAAVLVKGLLADQKGTVYWEAIAYEWWGHLDALRGQMTSARGRWRDALRITEQRGTGGAYVLRSARRALGERFLLEDPAAGQALLDHALERYPLATLPPLDRPYGNLAMAYAASGNPTVAKALLAEYERTPEADHSANAESWSQGARGVIALVEGRTADAISHFKTFDAGNSCATCGDPWIGRAYEKAGNPDSAEVYFRRFVDMPSAELWYDDAHLVHALRSLGRIYERRSDIANARAVYSRLATLYENAEPAFRPIYDEARAALGRLSNLDG